LFFGGAAATAMRFGTRAAIRIRTCDKPVAPPKNKTDNYGDPWLQRCHPYGVSTGTPNDCGDFNLEQTIMVAAANTISDSISCL
jgi:hypothetical protein